MKIDLPTGLTALGVGLLALAAVLITSEPKPAPAVPYLVNVGLYCDGEDVRLYGIEDGAEAAAACASVEIHAVPQAER